MPYLIFPDRWAQMPEGDLAIDETHPLARNLAFAFIPGVSFTNCGAPGSKGVFTGSGTPKTFRKYRNAGGTLLHQPDAASYWTFGNQFGISPTKMSIAARGAFTASGAIAFGNRSGSSGWGFSSVGAGDVVRFDLILFGVANQQATVTADFFIDAYGKPRSFGASHVSNTTGGLKFYFDGATLGAAVNTGVPIASTNPQQVHSYGDSGAQGSNFAWEHLFIWRDLILPDEAFAELDRQPYALIRRAPTPVFYSIAAGGFKSAWARNANTVLGVRAA